jgi:hypothetical protein
LSAVHHEPEAAGSAAPIASACAAREKVVGTTNAWYVVT